MDKLNDLILNFTYCFLNKINLPKKFEIHHINVNETTLKLTAGQLLVLIFNLPLILGPIMKLDDVNWINFLKLHQIVCIKLLFHLLMKMKL